MILLFMSTMKNLSAAVQKLPKKEEHLKEYLKSNKPKCSKVISSISAKSTFNEKESQTEKRIAECRKTCEKIQAPHKKMLQTHREELAVYRRAKNGYRNSMVEYLSKHSSQVLLTFTIHSSCL